MGKRMPALLLMIGICSVLVGCRNHSTNVTSKPTASITQGTGESSFVPDKSSTVSSKSTHTHVYSHEITAPSCTTDGYTTFICICGDTYTAEVVRAFGHSYSKKITAPTFTKTGYTIYTCSACDDSYTGNKTKATGHNWGSWTIVKEPTNTAEGKERRICKDCGTTDSRNVEKVVYEVFDGSIGIYNAHNLAYTDWKGDTEQTAFIEVCTNTTIRFNWVINTHNIYYQ